jgi:glycosyltransferase involved in cell wall biosynthesis
MSPPNLVESPAAAPAQTGWPRVTVIVPVYNHAAYAEEALDSVVNTHYPELEIIVINDASKDGSGAVIADWMRRNPDQNVVFLNHEHNLGLTKSLNEAVRIARGDYVCLLAGDDALLPGGIADRVRYLLDHPHKLAVFADCHVMDQDGAPLYESGIEDLYPRHGMRKSILAFDELIPASIAFHWAVPGPVFLCRAEAFKIVGPYDETLVAEDWDMYLRLAAGGRLGFLPRCVARYRVHAANLCATRNDRISLDLYRTAKKNVALFRGASALRLVTIAKHYEYLKAPTPLSKCVAYLAYGYYYHASRFWYRVQRKLIKLRRPPAGAPCPARS